MIVTTLLLRIVISFICYIYVLLKIKKCIQQTTTVVVPVTFEGSVNFKSCMLR